MKRRPHLYYKHGDSHSAGAVTYAKQWNLRPGIALTGEQMARLTSDIVWLVEQDIVIPPTYNADGSLKQAASTTKALVPQVYLRLREGDLSPNGALIAGKNIDLNLKGDLSNSGTIAGRNVTSITAENLNNLGGRITGEQISATARNDLNNIGGTIQAQSALFVSAGRDINVTTTTNTTSNRSGNNNANSFSQTSVDRVAGLYVANPNGILAASAGRDLNLTGVIVANNGAGSYTQLTAGNNVNLSTVQTSKSESIVWDAKNSRSQSSSQEVGTSITGGGALVIKAGQDFNARAANIDQQGAVQIQAARDLNLIAGQATSTFDEAHSQTSKGFLSKKSTTTRDSINTTSAQGTSIGGQTVSLVAGNNLTAQGATIISDQGTALRAGNDVTLTTAQNTQTETHYTQTQKSGFTAMQGGGFNVGYSANKSTTTATSSQTTATASTVASIGGNVTIQAGGTYRQTGSDVLTPKGDIDISAKRVEITESRETTQNQSRTDTKTTGISIGLSNGVLGAAQSINSMASSAKQTDNTRAKALAGAAAGLTAYNTAADIAKNPSSASAVSVGITLSSSKSTSTTQSSTDTAKGSNLAAGGSVSIKATGGDKSKGEDSDIVIQGSTIDAGKNVRLKADDDILLLASKDTTSEQSSNKSSGMSVGVSVGQGGVGVTVGVSKGKGSGNGASTTYNNTSIKAGNLVDIDSGSDTKISGANVAGKQVTANIGGNLTIESLQDTATYQSKQQNASGSATFGAGAGGSVSVSQSKINSTYQSVGTQSGIAAGVKDKDGKMVDGGFQINVLGATTLTGGKITSADKAVNDNANSFASVGGITATDIQNSAAYSAAYSAKSASLTVGTGGGGGGVGAKSGSASSTTQSGITGITGSGNAALKTGDAETSIKPIFDKDKVTKDITAQVQITQQFGMQASKTVGDEMGKKEKELKAQADKETDPTKKAELSAEAAKWGEGGAYRIAAHAVIGGLTGGNVQGALGAAASAAPLLDQLQAGITQSLVNSGMNPKTAEGIAKGLTGLTAAGIAAAASGGSAAGAAAALNSDMNNRQLHPSEREKAKAIAAKSGGKFTVKEIEDAMRALGNNDLGENVTTGTVVQTNDPKGVYDSGAVFGAGATGSGAMIQVIMPVNPDAVKFLVAQTGGENSTYVPLNWNAAPATVSPAGRSAIQNNRVTAEYAAGLLPAPSERRSIEQIDKDLKNRICKTAVGAAIPFPTSVIPKPIYDKLGKVVGWVLNHQAQSATSGVVETIICD